MACSDHATIGESGSPPKPERPKLLALATVSGEPTDEPFAGTLRHHGWRAVDTRLPALADGLDRSVLAPAEVELS